jgi:hypothetical protein
MSFDLRVVSGDLALSNGDLLVCTDSTKLIQDILKICLTPCGADPVNPWYGSYVSRSLVGNVFGTSITVQLCQSQLQSAIENLMALQKVQIKSAQPVTPDEILGSISNISINRSKSDPRLFSVAVNGTTKGFKPISTSFQVSPI